MTPADMSRPLTAEEFEKMMSEFDLTGEWMRKRLALGHGALTSATPASAKEGFGLSRNGQES